MNNNIVRTTQGIAEIIDRALDGCELPGELSPDRKWFIPSDELRKADVRDIGERIRRVIPQLLAFPEAWTEGPLTPEGSHVPSYQSLQLPLRGGWYAGLYSINTAITEPRFHAHPVPFHAINVRGGLVQEVATLADDSNKPTDTITTKTYPGDTYTVERRSRLHRVVGTCSGDSPVSLSVVISGPPFQSDVDHIPMRLLPEQNQRHDRSLWEVFFEAIRFRRLSSWF